MHKLSKRLEQNHKPNQTELDLFMNIKTKFKSFIAAALFSTVSNVVAANTVDSTMLAPMASVEDAKMSFRDLPYLQESFIDLTPAAREDQLAVGELGVDSGTKDEIIKLAKEVANDKHGLYDSMLISHQGKLLFESYYKRGRVNLHHGQASATKAYTSMALGRAIQLGYLTMADLQKPLISFLKDLDTSKLAEGSEKITLHKALTMHGGLSIDRDKWQELKKNPAAIKGQLLVQALLEHSAPITSESQQYLYGNYNPILVMAVIDAVVPGSAENFLKKEILDKLGITNYTWKTHVSGIPEAGWGVNMTSRDMVKLGTVVLNKGKWQGEQLISANYLVKATSSLVKPTEDWMPDNFRYGYFWYQTDITVGDKSYDATFAWGGGGQRIIVVAALDLIIVITGHEREDKIFTQISERVIPAFIE